MAHTSNPSDTSGAPFMQLHRMSGTFAQSANPIPATGPKSPLIIRSRADIHSVIRIQSECLGNSI